MRFQTGQVESVLVEPAHRPPVRRVERPRAKPASAAKRPLGQRTRGRRRLDGFNRLLQELYSRPVRFNHLLAKQGIPRARIERWRQDGIGLVRFFKRLNQELLAMLAEAKPDQDPRVSSLWYGLNGEGELLVEAIAVELGMMTVDVRLARWVLLRYLQGENGRAALEKAVLTAAEETKYSYEQPK